MPPSSQDIVASTVIGAFSGLVIAIINEQLFPKPLSEEEQRRLLLSKLSPTPTHMHIDPELVQIFVDIARFRDYSNDDYCRALTYADEVCYCVIVQAELTDEEVEHAKKHIDTVMRALKRLYKAIKARHMGDISARQSRQSIRMSKRQTDGARQSGELDPDEIYDLYDISQMSASDIRRQHELYADRLPHEILAKYIDVIAEHLGSHMATIVNNRPESN